MEVPEERELVESQRQEGRWSGDFPVCPVAKTPGSPCRGLGFEPWSGN